jgi:hypothetical protein
MRRGSEKPMRYNLGTTLKGAKPHEVTRLTASLNPVSGEERFATPCS